jgi:hypothetical protein
VSDDPHRDSNEPLAARVARFRSEIEAALQHLEAPLPAAAVSRSEDPSRMVEAIQAVLDAGPEGQRAILRAVLDASALVFPRSLILIGRDDRLVEWERRGRSGNGGERASVSLEAGGDGLPARARVSGSLVSAGPEGPGAALVEALGGAVPAASASCPLLVRGRSVAILYGDAPDPRPGAAAWLGVFARLGGTALELHALARRARSAEPGAGVPVPARVAVSLARGREGADAPPAAPEEAEMQALLLDLDPPARRDPGETDFSPEERRQHNDARRFASLLVSELLLYNEEAVIQGRKQRDLSHRLAAEIERTRQAYQARVPTAVRTGPRYLEEELLRVLAEGDEALMSH